MAKHYDVASPRRGRRGARCRRTPCSSVVACRSSSAKATGRRPMRSTASRARPPPLHVPRGDVTRVGPHPHRARAVAGVSSPADAARPDASESSGRTCASSLPPDAAAPSLARSIASCLACGAWSTTCTPTWRGPTPRPTPRFDRDVGLWPPGTFWERRETSRGSPPGASPPARGGAAQSLPRRASTRPPLPRDRRPPGPLRQPCQRPSPLRRRPSPRRVDARAAPPRARRGRALRVCSWSGFAPTAARRASADRAPAIVHRGGKRERHSRRWGRCADRCAVRRLPIFPCAALLDLATGARTVAFAVRSPPSRASTVGEQRFVVSVVVRDEGRPSESLAAESFLHRAVDLRRTPIRRVRRLHLQRSPDRSGLPGAIAARGRGAAPSEQWRPP